MRSLDFRGLEVSSEETPAGCVILSLFRIHPEWLRGEGCSSEAVSHDRCMKCSDAGVHAFTALQSFQLHLVPGSIRAETVVESTRPADNS